MDGSFKNLIVWQKALLLVRLVYRASKALEVANILTALLKKYANHLS